MPLQEGILTVYAVMEPDTRQAKWTFPGSPIGGGRGFSLNVLIAPHQVGCEAAMELVRLSRRSARSPCCDSASKADDGGVSATGSPGRSSLRVRERYQHHCMAMMV